jgi:hypothetical protein
MQVYEIRVLNRNYQTSAVIEESHANPSAAIQAARRYAGSWPFEVWLGADCLCAPRKRLVLQPLPYHAPMNERPGQAARA